MSDETNATKEEVAVAEKKAAPAETQQYKPLSTALKFFYGVGDFGFNLMSSVETYYFVFFLTNFAFMIVASIADAIPGASYWENEAGFHAIFGLTPRIALASFVSFIAGSFVNAYVMSRMKIADKGKRFPLRAIMSTIWGEGADSLFFFPLAFYGVLPNEELPLMMLSQLVLKTVYEIIVLPVTIRVVNWVKRYEGEDYYDNNVSYNIFAVFLGNKKE